MQDSGGDQDIEERRICRIRITHDVLLSTDSWIFPNKDVFVVNHITMAALA